MVTGPERDTGDLDVQVVTCMEGHSGDCWPVPSGTAV